MVCRPTVKTCDDTSPETNFYTVAESKLRSSAMMLFEVSARYIRFLLRFLAELCAVAYITYYSNHRGVFIVLYSQTNHLKNSCYILM